jgi:hypothetical protein
VLLFGIELLPMVKLGLSKDFYGLGTLHRKGKSPSRSGRGWTVDTGQHVALA